MMTSLPCARALEINPAMANKYCAEQPCSGPSGAINELPTLTTARCHENACINNENTCFAVYTEYCILPGKPTLMRLI